MQIMNVIMLIVSVKTWFINTRKKFIIIPWRSGCYNVRAMMHASMLIRKFKILSDVLRWDLEQMESRKMLLRLNTGCLVMCFTLLCDVLAKCLDFTLGCVLRAWLRRDISTFNISSSIIQTHDCSSHLLNINMFNHHPNHAYSTHPHQSQYNYLSIRHNHP